MKQILSINDFCLEHVEIYFDAVQVKKSIKLVSDSQAEFTICGFSHLIDPNSIKLVCNAQIGHVIIQRTDIDSSILSQLEQELNTEIIKLKTISKKKKILNNFADKIVGQKHSDNFFTFLESFYEKDLSLENQKNKCLDNIKILKQKIQEKVSTRSFEVKFMIHTDQNDFNLNLVLNYQSSGIGWTPLYDFKFDSRSKSVMVEIYALVEQKMSEEWTNVKASFWSCYINSSQELPRVLKFKTMQSKSVQQMLNDMRSHINHRTSGISTSQPSYNFGSVFRPEQKFTIKTGCKNFLICTINLVAEIRYEAIGNQSSCFQTKAKIKNTSGFVLMEGDIGVYLNGGFMKKSRIKNWFLLEEIELFIGSDDLTKIAYDPLSISKGKNTEKKCSYLLEQSFCVANDSDELKELFVLDSIPTSSDEKISVKILEPTPKQGIKPQLNKHGCFEFCFYLEPGQKSQNSIRYSIEYPNDKQIELH